jgi:hypothetical protein
MTPRWGFENHLNMSPLCSSDYSLPTWDARFRVPNNMIPYEDCKWHHENWDTAERRWTYDGRVSEDGTWHHKVWDSDGERWTYEDPGKVWNSLHQRFSSVTSATECMRVFLFLQEFQDELITYTYHKFNSWPCPSVAGRIRRRWDAWYPTGI